MGITTQTQWLLQLLLSLLLLLLLPLSRAHPPAAIISIAIQKEQGRKSLPLCTFWFLLSYSVVWVVMWRDQGRRHMCYPS